MHQLARFATGPECLAARDYDQVTDKIKRALPCFSTAAPFASMSVEGLDEEPSRKILASVYVR